MSIPILTASLGKAELCDPWVIVWDGVELYVDKRYYINDTYTMNMDIGAKVYMLKKNDRT